jgi:hypothetical protein
MPAKAGIEAILGKVTDLTGSEPVTYANIV